MKWAEAAKLVGKRGFLLVRDYSDFRALYSGRHWLGECEGAKAKVEVEIADLESRVIVVRYVGGQGQRVPLARVIRFEELRDDDRDQKKG